MSLAGGLPSLRPYSRVVDHTAKSAICVIHCISTTSLSVTTSIVNTCGRWHTTFSRLKMPHVWYCDGVEVAVPLH